MFLSVLTAAPFGLHFSTNQPAEFGVVFLVNGMDGPIPGKGKERDLGQYIEGVAFVYPGGSIQPARPVYLSDPTIQSIRLPPRNV